MHWQFLPAFDIVKLPHKTIQYRKTPLPMKRIPFDRFSDKRFYYANAPPCKQGFSLTTLHGGFYYVR